MQIASKTLLSAALVGMSLSGCYVVPANPEVYSAYPYGANTPLPPPPPARVIPSDLRLQALLYPANDKAAQVGVLGGFVTSPGAARGQFQLNYRGEMLNGESSRAEGDAGRVMASAIGTRGTFMSCEYQMHSMRQGAGTCTVSDGASFRVQIGN